MKTILIADDDQDLVATLVDFRMPAGAQAFFQKPFDRQTLLAKIKSLL